MSAKNMAKDLRRFVDVARGRREPAASNVVRRAPASAPDVGPVHEAEPLPCIKVAFSESDVVAAARAHRQRPYACNVCGMWHLTSRRRR